MIVAHVQVKSFRSAGRRPFFSFAPAVGSRNLDLCLLTSKLVTPRPSRFISLCQSHLTRSSAPFWPKSCSVETSCLACWLSGWTCAATCPLHLKLLCKCCCSSLLPQCRQQDRQQQCDLWHWRTISISLGMNDAYVSEVRSLSRDKDTAKYQTRCVKFTHENIFLLLSLKTVFSNAACCSYSSGN